MTKHIEEEVIQECGICGFKGVLWSTASNGKRVMKVCRRGEDGCWYIVPGKIHNCLAEKAGSIGRAKKQWEKRWVDSLSKPWVPTEEELSRAKQARGEDI